jgi:UDP-N-acetylmuramate--alanine ligase
LVLTSVYAAGESPIAGADGQSLARAVRVRGAVEPVFVENIEELDSVLSNIIADGDIVLTLGAGSIGAVAATLPTALAIRSPIEVKR